MFFEKCYLVKRRMVSSMMLSSSEEGINQSHLKSSRIFDVNIISPKEILENSDSQELYAQIVKLLSNQQSTAK